MATWRKSSNQSLITKSILVLIGALFSNSAAIIVNVGNDFKMPAPQDPDGKIFDTKNGYRYGASIIKEESGKIHAWFSSSTDPHIERMVATSPITEKVPFSGLRKVITFSHRVSTISIDIIGGDNAYIYIYKGKATTATSLAKCIPNTKCEISTTPGFDAGSYEIRIVGTKPVYVLRRGSSSSSWEDYQYSKTYPIMDVVTYRSSIDDGLNWTNEVVAIEPTYFAADHYSICDPEVTKIGNYYYLGYTSTWDPDGKVAGNVFLARSLYPDRGFEKWNGSNWGGNPKPIITWDGSELGKIIPGNPSWGVGEPSFVQLNGTLYIYYTFSDNFTKVTMLATADVSDLNKYWWPADIRKPRGDTAFQDYVADTNVQQGSAFSAHAFASSSVKYFDDEKLFVAVSAPTIPGDKGIPPQVSIVRKSSDGLTFHFSHYLTNEFVGTSTSKFYHSIGMSGDEKGHYLGNTKLHISYSAGEFPANKMGDWPTYWISLDPAKVKGLLLGNLSQANGAMVWTSVANNSNHVNDGDASIQSTPWVSANPTDHIQISHAATKRANRCKIKFDENPSQARAFSIQASDDGSTWSTIDVVNGHSSSHYEKTFPEMDFKYFRVNTVNTGIKIYEIEIYQEYHINRAFGKLAIANFEDAYWNLTGSKIVDGKFKTWQDRWSSAVFGAFAPFTVVIDLGEEFPIRGYVLRQAGAECGPPYPKPASAFKVNIGSTINGPWSDYVVDEQNNQSYFSANQFGPNRLAFKTRFVRLEIITPDINSGFAQIQELEIY